MVSQRTPSPSLLEAEIEEAGTDVPAAIAATAPPAAAAPSSSSLLLQLE